MPSDDQTIDAAWYDHNTGLCVYADNGEFAGTVRIILPSMINLSPYDALAFSRAIAAAADVAETRRAP